MTDSDNPFSKYAILRELSAAAGKSHSLRQTLMPDVEDVAPSPAVSTFLSGRPKSFAQVGTLDSPRVGRPKSGGLKPRRFRPHRLMGRFSDEERINIVQKAKAAGLSVNEYIRASALGFNYKPPLDKASHKILLALHYELLAQGRNLNQIAKYLNSGLTTITEGMAKIELLRQPLLQTLQVVRTALANGAERMP